MERRKKRRLSNIILLIVAVAVIAVALYHILPQMLDYRKSEDTFQKLDEQYVHVTGEEDAASAEEKNPDWWVEDVQIAFEELKKENDDIIGWIRFDNQKDLDISYPLLYSGDDTTYLRTDIYGEHRTAGCIFLSGDSKPDFSDYHAIIYGHNMHNGTMFGKLKMYKDEENFYEKNKYFTIYTMDKARRYQVFSYHDVAVDSDLYMVGFGPDEEYAGFIDQMAAESYEDTGIRPQMTDHTITLSTCSTKGETMRFMVHAVLVDEKDYTAAKTTAEE